MYLTRQDHIDRMVREVGPCPMPRVAGLRSRDTRVMFVNQSWACSSGHISNLENPNLRTPDRDPSAWIRENPEKILQTLPIELCSVHREEPIEDGWGMAGHLYHYNHDGIMALCLPMAELGAI